MIGAVSVGVAVLTAATFAASGLAEAPRRVVVDGNVPLLEAPDGHPLAELVAWPSAPIPVEALEPRGDLIRVRTLGAVQVEGWLPSGSLAAFVQRSTPLWVGSGPSELLGELRPGALVVDLDWHRERVRVRWKDPETGTEAEGWVDGRDLGPAAVASEAPSSDSDRPSRWTRAPCDLIATPGGPPRLRLGAHVPLIVRGPPSGGLVPVTLASEAIEAAGWVSDKVLIDAPLRPPSPPGGAAPVMPWPAGPLQLTGLGGATLRSRPDPAAPVVARLAADVPLEAQGPERHGWLEVRTLEGVLVLGYVRAPDVAPVVD